MAGAAVTVEFHYAGGSASTANGGATNHKVVGDILLGGAYPASGTQAASATGAAAGSVGVNAGQPFHYVGGTASGGATSHANAGNRYASTHPATIWATGTLGTGTTAL